MNERRAQIESALTATLQKNAGLTHTDIDDALLALWKRKPPASAPSTAFGPLKIISIDLQIPAKIKLASIVAITGLGGRAAAGWEIRADDVLKINFEVPAGLSTVGMDYHCDISYRELDDEKQFKLADTWREILAKLA